MPRIIQFTQRAAVQDKVTPDSEQALFFDCDDGHLSYDYVAATDRDRRALTLDVKADGELKHRAKLYFTDEEFGRFLGAVNSIAQKKKEPEVVPLHEEELTSAALKCYELLAQTFAGKDGMVSYGWILSRLKDCQAVLDSALGTVGGSKLEKGLLQLREVMEIQGRHGNWDHDEYMRGMYNGLACALSCFTGENPVYKDAPKTPNENIRVTTVEANDVLVSTTYDSHESRPDVHYRVREENSSVDVIVREEKKTSLLKFTRAEYRRFRQFLMSVSLKD